MKVQTLFGLLCITQGLSPQMPSAALLSLHLLDQWQEQCHPGTQKMAYVTAFHCIRQHVQNWQVNWRIKLSLPHLQAPLRISAQVCEAWGECTGGGERSLSKHSVSLRTGSSHRSLCLTFLFPRCTHVYITCFSAIQKTGLWRCWKTRP